MKGQEDLLADEEAPRQFERKKARASNHCLSPGNPTQHQTSKEKGRN
jgi:hypothetical protein